MLNNFLKKLKSDIKQGEQNSPCLFVGENLELNNSKINDIAINLLKDFSIPKSYLYTLEDNQESIKIKEIKEFIKFSESRPPYPIQIFFIENISRLTISASNCLLKILEEPGKYNIFFLSSQGENKVLETILSRVKIINLGGNKNLKKNLFYYDLIKNYKLNKKDDIFSYFFKNKLEKEEYILFLKNLIIYFKNNIGDIDSNLLFELDEDINGIGQNNLNAKNIVDKWLMLI